MRSKMTIGKKLITAFSALLALTVGLGCLSLLSLRRLGDEIDVITDQVAKRADLAHRMRASIWIMRTSQRGVVMFALKNSPDRQRQSDEMFRSEERRLQELMNQFRPLVVTEQGRQSLSGLQADLTAWQPAYEALLQRCNQRQFDGDFDAVLDNIVVFGDRMQGATEQLVELQQKMMASTNAESDDTVLHSIWTTVVVLALSLLTGIIGLVVVRNTSRTLQRAASELGESAGQVASAAVQISSASQSLAQGATEQAASLEETSASSEQISAMTRKNADDSRSAAELMNETGQVVSVANLTLGQMEASMQEINASSEKIGKIIKVIDGIAFQTNILALNAAVEAARAGEAGMGFAVVADEVKNLAQRSAEAARDTAGMIEDSIGKSREGRAKLEEVSRAIQAITGKSAQVRVLVDNVNSGSTEQSRGVEQISKAIMQVEQVTQTSAASAEEAAAAAAELNAQSAALKGIVGRLEEMVGAARD